MARLERAVGRDTRGARGRCERDGEDRDRHQDLDQREAALAPHPSTSVIAPAGVAVDGPAQPANLERDAERNAQSVGKEHEALVERELLPVDVEPGDVRRAGSASRGGLRLP